MNTAPARTSWTSWAEHAEPRICDGCGCEFKPNHPRRRFCQGDDCPGKESAPRSRRRASSRAQASARAVGVQGFLADVLVESNRVEQDPGPEAIGAALVAFARARRDGDLQAARAAAVRMCAMGATAAVLLVPVPE